MCHVQDGSAAKGAVKSRNLSGFTIDCVATAPAATKGHMHPVEKALEVAATQSSRGLVERQRRPACRLSPPVLYNAAMRIAQLAPPWITVPPAGYGGTEWVVQQLCDGLAERGHEVRLYATGDSHTAAELCALFPEQMPDRIGVTPFDARHTSFAFADIEQSEFDLIHDHSGFIAVAFSRYLATPMVHTVHCAFDEFTMGFYEQFARDVGYIGISEYQQSMAPAGMDWAGIAYNAIPAEQWPYTTEKDDYLLAFGRVCEAKGFHHSIATAKRLGRKLIMAGVLQEPYRAYFEECIAPEIDGEQIVYEGEVSMDRKRELFAQASAFLFPITWPEPFGLVMIEAMACGTPVVAMRQGSVPEVVDDGKTGFVVDADDLDAFVAAVGRVGEIDPAVCRRTVEERFTVERMVADYEAVYRRYLER
jgi:glycosyltransferase involved in cell wall biosynthesis